MFRKVEGAEFPAEFYWDDKLLVYKRGNTTCVEKLDESASMEEVKIRFQKLFNVLLEHHEGDEEAQEFFFSSELDGRFFNKVYIVINSEKRC